ncbi:MAG: bifunctional cobalt-precorrin-7 (C(5))-methyltransferase/cobalt-precorrin-6B (C(15))-methyltransferase [Clostridium sp.]|uniref:bifunctional cobalt-precorrin-7 (C(5))-methyltransferase/cobalt-precorrin-6B (C(15))-methyltransferase n=1 Tax=Clostridium culturomicium TaxID=1499683 RepID=UPI00058FC9F7|nr:bifunctional cobalt-precorrin-7 (C(5))-methyltransferase/cobalt-precorrin-6B (C(15))-methyltransferase [Clostridium culturomicium]MDU4892109.1 bifunctional cobalt-precorrin-7 (C(5))-methyltransferase/cobalt-precorrin-6B (C(15))-methyltransferase [Clostridium sp.]MDU7082496.1 bifunctional cobalt-precorrin-7 (C(5))-methyltransferase/cobalt-precorrin-6B (C(15))-methyltransferase [Clostridium sp.]
MLKQVYIIGAGTGCLGMLTAKGREIIQQCDELYSTNRIGELMTEIRRDIENLPISEISLRVLESEASKVGVLVSGDTGFFSMTKSLLKSLEGKCQVEVICGISSMQYLCSKTGRSYENMKIVSLHGRNNSILGAVSYFPQLFVLTGGSNKAHDICRFLSEQGLGEVRIIAGENLSMASERIIEGTAKELSELKFEDLTVLIIENYNCTDHNISIRDEELTRGKVPMTKEEVRFVTIAKMKIKSKDIIYDIGAGTGSVAFEMARKAYKGMVYAIETNPDGIELIKENRRLLSGYNVITVEGMAPQVMEELPRPDKAFIGGSKGNMDSIIKALVEKNPEVFIAINAITLETLNEAMKVMEANGFDAEIVCINSARSKKVGGYNMMTANNPVYIISGGRYEQK